MGSLNKFNLTRIISGFNTMNLFETGTFWGDGIAYALQYPFAKIISVEIVPQIAAKAAARFRKEERVTILESDSISALTANLPSLQGNSLFWLDAHYPGSDAGLTAYDSNKNETERLPLHHELEVIANYRSAFNDVIIIDDLRIYEDGPYENGNVATEALPTKGRNLNFLDKLFSRSHNVVKLYQDEGYILLIPKRNFERNNFNLRDFLLLNPYPGPQDSGHSNWGSVIHNDVRNRRSELCKTEDCKSLWYESWCTNFGEPVKIHRRQWEYAFVLQALFERGCIAEGKNGLGFSVFSQPLPSLLVHRGCNILGTGTHDQDSGNGFIDGSSPLTSQSFLRSNLCDPEIFQQRFHYRNIPMHNIPGDINGFDFNWSCSSLQQLGEREKCLDFVKNQLQTVKPGGWSIHTMDFNLSSNDTTIDNGSICIFRKRDIEELIDFLRAEGHVVEEPDFSLGGFAEDFAIDLPPYKNEPHLRLLVDKHVITTIGLIIQKKL